MDNKKNKLTPKQKAFCDEYLKSGNATQSYIKVGYTQNEEVARTNASRLLTNARIKEYIKARQEKVQNKNILTIAQIQEDLTEIAKCGKEKTNDRLKAFELLTRMQGGFLDRQSITADVSVDFEDKLKEVEDVSEF